MKKIEMTIGADIINYKQIARFDLIGIDENNEVSKHVTLAMPLLSTNIFLGHTFSKDEMIALRDWCDEVLKDGE